MALKKFPHLLCILAFYFVAPVLFDCRFNTSHSRKLWHPWDVHKTLRQFLKQHQQTFSALRRLLFWLLLLLTLWLSLIPGDQVPSQLHFWDKAQHALGFAGLTFLGLQAYPGRIRQLMFGLMLLGAGIECAQALTGWRQGDWADWVADCVGLLMGYAAWQASIWTFRSRPK